MNLEMLAKTSDLHHCREPKSSALAFNSTPIINVSARLFKMGTLSGGTAFLCDRP